MGTMRKLLAACALAACAMGAVACGGDDNTVAPGGSDGGGDAGADVAQPPADGGGGDTGGGNDGGGGDTGPGPDAGCDFAAFVVDMVNNHTADNTQPSTDLGEACTDKQDQTQFSSLF